MKSALNLNKRWKELFYAATGFGPNLLMVLMTAYFTDALIPTGLMADIQFWSYDGKMIVSALIFPILWTIGRIFDGIIDVPLAAFTDNLKNKTGKRWIAIVIAVVPMILSFILCWIPVFGKSENMEIWQYIGNSFWIFTWSIVFFASYTLALITFYGSLSDVCVDQTQRARVSAYKSVFDTITYALAYAAIPAIFRYSGISIWQVALILSPLMVTILFPLFLRKKGEDKLPVSDEKKEKSVPIGQSIVMTLKSKPFLKWSLVNCLSFFGLQMFLVAQNTLISGVMGLGAGYAAILNTCAFAPVPLMLLLFNRLRKTKGIRFAYQTCVLSFGISILSFCLGGSYFWGDQLLPKLVIGAVGGVIGSWGIGAFFMVPYLIPTSIASVEEEVIGKNHSAMYFAIQALFTSVVGAIASSLIYNYLKLWTVTSEAGVEYKCGVSLVPAIVLISCVVCFFLCFFMPKRYTAKTIYSDIKESAEKDLAILNRKKDTVSRDLEKEIARINSYVMSDSEKTILIEEKRKNAEMKLAKISYQMIPHQQILDYKFEESKSIGNEEDRIVEKDGLFSTIALFVLTGGIFGIVNLFLDMSKLKKIGIRITPWQTIVLILSLFIPFLSVYTVIFFDEKIKEYNKKIGIKDSTHLGICIPFCFILPLFMNVVSIAVRTNNFNKISDKISEKR